MVKNLRPKVVADFSAGGGSLLLAAKERWPDVSVVATDIRRSEVRRTQAAHPGWLVGSCDFLNSRSRARCKALQKLKGRVSLLVLNPPFTCRGASKHHTVTSFGEISSSSATAFLLTSLDYLSPAGHAVVILPAASLDLEKDAVAWSSIRLTFNVEILTRGPKGTFPTCSASATVVLLSRKKRTDRLSREAKRPSKTYARHSVRLIRGTYPYYRAEHSVKGTPLVHTTDMKHNTVIINGARGKGQHPTVSGPVILVPRVGKLSSQKIGLYRKSAPVMLSDCVIAMKARSRSQANTIATRLHDNFDGLADQYVGTGAPFITLKRLRSFLATVGIDTQ